MRRAFCDHCGAVITKRTHIRDLLLARERTAAEVFACLDPGDRRGGMAVLVRDLESMRRRGVLRRRTLTAAESRARGDNRSRWIWRAT